MPYQPLDNPLRIFYIPKWHEAYPDRHPRWISIDSRRMAGHMTDYGTGAYRQFGDEFTALDELKTAVRAIGLNETYINTTLQRVMLGDMMLAWIPEAEYQRRFNEKLSANEARVNEALDAYLGSQTSKGVKPVVVDADEFDDKKSFHNRPSNNRVGYTGAGAR